MRQFDQQEEDSMAAQAMHRLLYAAVGVVTGPLESYDRLRSDGVRRRFALPMALALGPITGFCEGISLDPLRYADSY